MSHPELSTSWMQSLSAAVVEPGEVDKKLAVLVLTSVGFRVSVFDNFLDARQALASDPPFVLVADVRLGPFNGLHLALCGRSIRSNMAVIVTSDTPDPVLQRSADDAGAAFVVKPLHEPELVAALYRTALRRPGIDGAVAPIRAPFERRSGERRHAAIATPGTERRATERRRDAVTELSIAASASRVRDYPPVRGPRESMSR